MGIFISTLTSFIIEILISVELLKNFRRFKIYYAFPNNLVIIGKYISQYKKYKNAVYTI